MISPIFIGIDDTDILSSPGTGRLVREIGAALPPGYGLIGTTRHQLLFDSRIPMTAKNSANVIHLHPHRPLELPALADEVAAMLQARFTPGSDPGLCVAAPPPPAITQFGRRAKKEVVSAEEAQTLAAAHQIILRPLGGDGGGIIGALAAVGLAASGNDGRFNWVGQVRALAGRQPVEAILAAGVQAVQQRNGERVTTGIIHTEDKIRPSLINGQPVLEVESVDGEWRPIRRD